MIVTLNLRICEKFILPAFVIINSNQIVKAGDFYLLDQNKNEPIIWSKVVSNKQIFPLRKFVYYQQDKEKLSNKNVNAFGPFYKSNNRNFGKNNQKLVTDQKVNNKKNDEKLVTDQTINDKKNNEKLITDQEVNSSKNNKESSLKTDSFNYKNKKEGLEIKSDIQSQKNNTLFARGNVLVSYQGKFLKADALIYDKSTKILKASGDIRLIIGEQIFKVDQIEYNFAEKKGFMLNVSGLINTKNFVDDIIADFSDSDIKKIESLKEIRKEQVSNTPGEVDNWILSANKINIDGDIWKSEKAIFTNDLLELKQIKIVINSLEASTEGEKLKFKSSLNYLILDEKLGVPFWFGNRTLTQSSEGFDAKNSWNVGYENLDKDGFFIGRKLNTRNLSNDFSLSLEPQFLIQRAFKGYTKSFVKKGDYITGNRIKRDTTFSDYFALNSEIKGKVNAWDLQIEKQINSFDFAKLNNSFRFKSSLSKEINLFDSKWGNSFYLVYRDRIWNGSLGESEIYTGFGSKLEKQNTWDDDGVRKTETFSFGLANLEGEALHSKKLVRSIKGNVFYSLDQKFPIIADNHSNRNIDSSYNYISEPIKKGLSLNTRVAFSSSLYEEGKHQEYLGFGAGPELNIGNFKNKFFDYTRISLFPFYKFKSGDSLFKFDQIPDKFTIDVSFDQQLYGPLVVKSNILFNLDNESDDYGDVINSKISLNWKRRSYDLGIFYQPHNKAGGIGFNLFGFE